MAARLLVSVILLTTIIGRECMPCKHRHDKKAGSICCSHKSGKHHSEHEKLTTVPDVIWFTTNTSQETSKEEGRTLELYNNSPVINTINTTEKPELSSTNNKEEKPTESSQNVSTKEDAETASSQLYTLYSPPSYEVHENVIDVPDDRLPAGPIVPTYTRPNLLNTVKPTNSTATDNGTDEITEENIQNKKNLVSILHIKVETDDRHKEEHQNPGIIKGIKDYFSGLHKGLLNSIHSLFHKKQKRSTDGHSRSEQRGKQNSDNVDKTDFFVRRQHISLT